MPGGEDFNDYLYGSCVGVCGIQRRGRRRQPREPLYQEPMGLIRAPCMGSVKMAEAALVRLSTQFFRVTDVSLARTANGSRKSDANMALKIDVDTSLLRVICSSPLRSRARARIHTHPHALTHR